jgi:TPR repeat protein
MHMTRTLAALAIGAAIALPATAQFGRVERTQTEIALEQAEARLAKLREARLAADTACKAGDTDACFNLADMQRTGAGGAQDLAAAARTYGTVCDARDGRGCAGLAYLTVQGRGVSENHAEGRALYEKACDYGDVSGCAAYGNMAYTGIGGRKDVASGTAALTEACNRSYQWACDRMRELGMYDPADRPFQRLRDLRAN